MNDINQVLQTIEPTLNFTQIIIDEPTEYQLNQENTWVDKLFTELEEETDANDPLYQEGFLTIDLGLKRRVEKPFGDHLLLSGHMQGEYFAPCVRCLKLTKQQLNENFSCAFLHDHLETEPEFEELDDIFTENKEFDLYFYTKGKIDLAEAVHEQLYTLVNPFPLHDENCKGLCPECGEDLNHGDCPHSKA